VQPLFTGRYRVGLAIGPADVACALALREQVFRSLPGRPGPDSDGWDGRCDHVVITDSRSGVLVGCFRMLPLTGREIHTSYSAQFHDLEAFSKMPGLLVEVGRFCTAPGFRDPDVLRLALAAMMLQAEGAALLFGCASFAGADPALHHTALSSLAAKHRAPAHHISGKPLQHAVPLPPPDPDASPAGLPPLLRAYLGLGAWVSHQAVIDRDLDTLHVLVGVETARIPPARLRSLRTLAAAASVPG